MISQEEALINSQKNKQEIINKELDKLLEIVESKIKYSISVGHDYTKICVDEYSTEALDYVELLLLDEKYRVKIKQTYKSVSGMRLPHKVYLFVGWNVSWWRWLWL